MGDILYWIEEESDANISKHLISLGTEMRAFTIWIQKDNPYIWTMMLYSGFHKLERNCYFDYNDFSRTAEDEPFFIQDPVAYCEMRIMSDGHRMATEKEMLLFNG